ncbi:15193_t:CDS:1 [Funneliformis caledonium]|uniref:15193_t:CDS:1 n=1 Tax=Funneliformis caledonium TaxID=1117310 RepID=A0A9N9IIC3_9GLOM|nr:15193_t:CDS:1 [Funneliformis caledonium]
MSNKMERKNTNYDCLTSSVNNKVLIKMQNMNQTLDKELTLNLPISIEPIITKDTNTIEINSVEKSSTNNFDKGKDPETLTLKTTVQKTIMNIDEFFDISENILDILTLGFEAPST